MAKTTYYIDRSDTPIGTKTPRNIRCSARDVPLRAIGLAETIPGEGQLGVYVDGPTGDFVGYAITENGTARFEPAEA